MSHTFRIFCPFLSTPLFEVRREREKGEGEGREEKRREKRRRKRRERERREKREERKEEEKKEGTEAHREGREGRYKEGCDDAVCITEEECFPDFLSPHVSPLLQLCSQSLSH